MTANFPLFASSRPALELRGVRYLLGQRKIGAVPLARPPSRPRARPARHPGPAWQIVGDGSQLGCGSVTDPGTLFAPDTHTYPLCRVPAGAYGPRELLKNRPLECGVLSRTPLLSSGPAGAFGSPDHRARGDAVLDSHRLDRALPHAAATCAATIRRAAS